MTDVDSGPRAVTLESPDATAATRAIREGVREGTVVTIFGRCTVDYEGRASSYLGTGDRLVVLKPDGTALVHAAAGQQPVNWQPPGCEHDAFAEDGEVCIESRRTTPTERLVIRFDRVFQISSLAVAESGSLSLVGTEEDLRQRVLDDPSLIEDGFTPLATERETSAGAVDIYGEDATGRSVVVELKRARAGPDATSQLRRYVDALERDLHAEASIRGILAAPSVTDRAARLLATHGLEFVAVEPPNP